MKCSECAAFQPLKWDLLICCNCGAELGIAQPDGEPVKVRPAYLPTTAPLETRCMKQAVMFRDGPREASVKE